MTLTLQSMCRSLELQGVLTCMACQLCYMHTDADPAPAVQADGDLAEPPRRPCQLNRTQLEGFGGVPQLLHCMHARPTRGAQRAALSVLLEVACARACRLDPSLEQYLGSSDAKRCACACMWSQLQGAVAPPEHTTSLAMSVGAAETGWCAHACWTVRPFRPFYALMHSRVM